MAEAQPAMTLTTSSQLTLLPKVRAFVEGFCRHAGLDDQTTASVVLAVHEAAANIIRHAHRCRSDLPIHIRCTEMSDGLEVCIDDEGEPFDITAVPEIDPTELREGGRGVYLMRALMDELTCRPRAAGGNTLRMVKRRRPVA